MTVFNRRSTLLVILCTSYSLLLEHRIHFFPAVYILASDFCLYRCCRYIHQTCIYPHGGTYLFFLDARRCCCELNATRYVSNPLRDTCGVGRAAPRSSDTSATIQWRSISIRFGRAGLSIFKNVAKSPFASYARTRGACQSLRTRTFVYVADDSEITIGKNTYLP